MNVTTRQLTLFEAFARLGTLSAAAAEQAISQPAASQSLKELERQLGYSLFRKSGRELQLTPAGEQALPLVRSIIGNINSLSFPDQDFIGGPLRISASETIGSYVLPKYIAKFVKRYPKVEPLLTVYNSQSVVQQIEKGYANLGFIEGPTQSSNVTVQAWQQDQLVVFSTPEIASKHNNRLNSRNFNQYQWIVREQGSGTRAVLDAGLAQSAVTLQQVMTLPRQVAIKQMVLAGVGIGCLSKWAIQDELELGSLVSLHTPMQLQRTFSVICLADEMMSPVSRQFYEFVFSQI